MSSTFPNPASRSVVVVDDHQALVDLLVPVIETIPGFKVVGTAGDLTPALQLCRQLQPDVVVLDLILPHGSGIALLPDLRQHCPQARILVFSGNLAPAAIRGAFSAGAAGFVEKAGSLSEFRDAIQAVAGGQTYFGKQTSALVKDLVCRNTPARSELTARERMVLRHIAEGLSSKEIASRLGISVHTVLNHRSRIMQKTGLHRVAQLSLYAAQIGLVGEAIQLPPESDL